MIVKHKILAAQKVVKAVNVVRVVRVVRVVKHTDNLQLKTCPQFFRHCAETGVLLLILIFTSCFFNSCDNRKDPYTGLDNTPVLTVQKLDSVKTCTYLTDSMKIGKPYVFKYNIISFENLPLNIVKTQVTDSVVVSNNLVYVNRLTEGLSEYFLKTTDPFGKAANANVAITFFINLPPVCEFTVTQAGMSIPCEIDINASSSYDQDSRWGGEVINYEYIIGTDYDTKTVLNNIQYIFDGPGQKKITVLCQDNNGTWSSPNTIYFSVTASDTTQNLIKKLSTK
jgi:hypothetical protein